jgi:NTE family protein
LKKGEPRLLLVAVDIQEAAAVVFDSYKKEDGTRKSQYGRYGRLKSVASAKDQENTEQFEHVIRYNDGIIADFVLASCSVPVNYDYTRLNVETHALDWEDRMTLQVMGIVIVLLLRLLRTAISVCAVFGTVDY